MTDYPQVTLQNAAAELNRLNSAIESNGRSMVNDAIRAGEILTKVKESQGMNHGEFLPWLKNNCSFSQRTAYNYIGLYNHSDKIASVANLQEAYQQIETIERQQKQTEEQKAKQRVDHYIKTGEKPEGWRRGTDDKLVEQEREWIAKRESMNEEWKNRDQQREKKRAERSTFDDEIRSLLESTSVQIDKRQSFKEKIRLSQSGESDLFIDALMDYLEELPDDNRRIESCQNIIKVCKNIAVQLQRGE